MVVGEKSHRSAGVGYRKMLNKQDPLDHLILELGQRGVLDISVVGLGKEGHAEVVQKYSRNTVAHRGKHSS